MSNDQFISREVIGKRRIASLYGNNEVQKSNVDKVVDTAAAAKQKTDNGKENVESTEDESKKFIVQHAEAVIKQKDKENKEKGSDNDDGVEEVEEKKDNEVKGEQINDEGEE